MSAPTPPPPYPPYQPPARPPVDVRPAPPVPSERPPTPWWAAVLAVLGVGLVLSLLVAGVSALLVESATREVSEQVDQDGVRTLRIVGVTGGANLVADPDAEPGTVTGRARVTSTWQDAELSTTRDGDELLLQASCPDAGWPRRCEIGYDLQVDPDVDVVVDIVTGGLRVQGLAGDVQASVSAGGVLLEDLTSRAVEVDVTTGGAAMSFAEAPDDVRVSTTTGGIGIGLPDDGEPWAVRTSVSVGGATVDVPTDDDATRSIEASTTVGGIQIGPADQGQWDETHHRAP